MALERRIEPSTEHTRRVHHLRVTGATFAVVLAASLLMGEVTEHAATGSCGRLRGRKISWLASVEDGNGRVWVAYPPPAAAGRRVARCWGCLAHRGPSAVAAD
jgi:hypothetical protein